MVKRVLNTGSPITVPVGRATLGRIMNVIGEPIDERGESVSNLTSVETLDKFMGWDLELRFSIMWC